MANGYLGKISAVVSASTGDFDAKLAKSAKEVANFASRVQGNLTSASTQAARALEGIYTPLQKVERSLRAAESLKLSFKGFKGLIGDVDALQRRLQGLNQRQIDIVLKTSGMKSITEFRDAVRGLSSKDVEIITRIGGLEKIKELQDQVRSSRAEIEVSVKVPEAAARVQTLKEEIKAAKEAGSDGVVIKTKTDELSRAETKLARLLRLVDRKVVAQFGVDANLAELDALAQKAEKASAVLGTLPRVMEELGRSDLNAATTRMRQMVSQSEELSKPIAAATQQFGTLTREVQAGFLPALSSVQSDLESLNSLIESGVAPTKAIEAAFNGVRESVDQTVAAVSRLAEASAKASKIKTGRELVFDQPELSESLDRGATVGAKAAALPAAALQANPRIAASLVEVNRLAQEAISAYSRLQSKTAENLPTGSAQKQLDNLVARLNDAQAVAENEIQIHLDTVDAQKKADDLAAKITALRERAAFVITGRPQNIDQADARRGQLEGDISGLNRFQRQNYKPLLEDATIARQLGDLDKYNDALDKIALNVAKDKKFNIDTAEAQKKAGDLKASIDSLRESADFQFTGLPQNRSQAESTLRSTIGKAGELDPAALSRITAAKDAAIAGLGNADFGAPLIKVFVDLVDKELQAKKAADDLTTAMKAIGDAANPSDPIDILKKNLAEARAAVAKLEGPLKAIGERNIAKIETFVGANAGNEAAARLAGLRAGQVRDAAVAAAPPPKPPKPPVDPLGADFGTAERRIASVQSTVIGLQGSLEKLPAPLQAQFIPAINKVRDAFKGLTTSSTQAQIDAVVKKAAGLERALTRAGQAAKLGGTLGDALNSAALTRTEKQIGFIRAKLLDLGATASGPVANAFNRYSAFVADAAKKGTIGLAATKEQADQLAEKIGEAALAAGLFKSKAEAAAFVKGVGDVGRAGADKFALALNQAAFAVDDFLSSTGGLEFKLRAVSNNVTQLAFILGDTTGLFVGLGAVIAGQAAVGLIKWINNGRSAEDQTKALNESLARQKSLVEDLAQAFRSLGDALSRGTFSAGGEQAADFARQVADINKKQREAREARVADIDPAVQRERAEQNKQRKKLESETDIGRRIAIQREIAVSEEREKAAKAAAVDRVVAPGEARARIRASMERVGIAALGPRRGDEAGRAAAEQRVRDRAAAATEGIPDGETPEAIRAQMAAIEKQIKSLSSTASAGSPLGFVTPEVASKEILALERLLRSLEQPLAAAIDKAATSVAEASRGPAAQIRQAQEDVAEAIRKGVPNAAAFQRELDANAKKLKAAYDALEAAQNETDPTKKQAKVDEAKANIDQVEAERANIRNRSREMRLGRTFGGERTTAALSSIQGNERFKGDGYSVRTTAYIEAAIDREIEARRQLEAATAKGADAEIKAAEAELEAAQKASEAAAAFAEAALAVEAALTRIRKVGESAVQRSEQGADAAQKAFEENPLRAGGGQSRDDAERRLIDDRARAAQAQVELDIRRSAVQNDPRMQGISKELEAITQRRADLEAKARTGSLNPAEQKELDAARRREIELMRQREHLARDLTEAERKQLDAINNGIAAREKELEKSRQRAAEDPTFKRRMDATNQLIADSERQANEARERFINNPSAENLRGRDEADENLRRDRQRAQELQDDLDNARREMESDPRVAGNNRAIAENDKRLAELAEKEASGGLTQGEKDERRRLQGENRMMRRENEGLIAAGTKHEQDAVDAQQQGIRDRDRARRGRELGMTPEERFRRDFQEGAGADINARAAEMRANGEDPQAFLRQAYRNQAEQVAPMFAQFAEERQNALLQGPSRAALNVSDVSTTQGQSELNRLLRGDDSAKDANLAELRKQSQVLEDIARSIKDNNPGVLL